MKKKLLVYKYIEVIDRQSGEVLQRMEASDMSDNRIERLMSGMSINLNHEKYQLYNFESTEQKETF